MVEQLELFPKFKLGQTIYVEGNAAIIELVTRINENYYQNNYVYDIRFVNGTLIQKVPEGMLKGELVNYSTFTQEYSDPAVFEKDVTKQNHYTQFKIQPAVFIGENNLGYFEGNIIKYVCRYKKKNGIEDLKKARHYLDMLISKVETGETKV